MDVETKLMQLSSLNQNEKRIFIGELDMIWNVYGVEKCIYEIFPYFIEYSLVNEQDIINTLESLTKIDFEVLSSNQFNHFMRLLRNFAEIDSLFVVNALACLIFHVLKGRKAEDISGVLYPFISELILKSEWIPDQVSGTCILKHVYYLINDELLDELIAKISKSIGKFSVHGKLIYCDFSKVVYSNISDESKDNILDSIESLSSETNVAVLSKICSVLCAFLDSSDFCLSIIKRLSKNPHYYVRMSLAINLHTYKTLSESHLNQLLKLLVNDTEPEVRIGAAQSLPHIFEHSQFEQVKPFINNLMNDNHEYVKSAALNTLEHFAEDDQLFFNENILLALSDDNTSVKQTAISLLKQAQGIFSSNSDLIPVILTKFSFREKYQVASQLDMNFDMSLFENLLFDDCYEVRNQAILSISRYIQLIGIDLLRSKLIITVNKTFSSCEYQIRQTGIELAATLNLFPHISDLIDAAIHDPISNVRIVLAKHIDKLSNNQIKQLMLDSDPEVKEYLKKD